MNKNVLFINHSIRDGGPGRSLFYLLKFLNRRVINPTILIPDHNVFTEQMRELGLEQNLIVNPLFPENIMRPLFGSNSNNNSSKRSSIMLKALSIFLNVIGLFIFILTSPFLIQSKKIDLIYCNGTLAKIVGALIGLVNMRPVIWHVRNIQQKTVMKILMKSLAKLPSVKKIICVSVAAATPFLSGNDKTVVVHNGLDLKEFNSRKIKAALRSEFPIPRGTIIIGSVGRIVSRKGYEFFVRVARELVNRCSDEEKKKIKFVVVGDTPHFFRVNHLEEIKDLVRENDLDKYFIFTGYKSDVRPYLKDFDIFVIPSNYPDPFPRSVIEAMSLSLPVVGFAQGGITESVENGVTGLLQEDSSEKTMAENILKLALDKDLRKAMGKAGRKRVREHYQADDISKQIEEQIFEVLNN